jgi:hypothetical protein
MCNYVKPEDMLITAAEWPKATEHWDCQFKTGSGHGHPPQVLVRPQRKVTKTYL